MLAAVSPSKLNRTVGPTTSVRSTVASPQAGAANSAHSNSSSGSVTKSVWSAFYGLSGLGFAYAWESVNESEYEDFSEELEHIFFHLGLEAGIFVAPKVLLEFSLDVLVWEWDLEHDFSPWKWYYLGGGLTYYHPISEKQFFDVGVRLGPQILDTAYYGSDTFCTLVCFHSEFPLVQLQHLHFD